MARYAFVLGTLSAAGPLAIDLYLPGLPSIAHDLHATQGQVEASMMSFFAGLMIGQPFYGPLSDRFGRKRPMALGILLYCIASIGCSMAVSAPMLVGARLIQGLGAGASISISAAIIRDVYTGHQAARLLALRMLVIGGSPILAPIIGATIISAFSWRYVFWLSAAFGLYGIGLLTLIPETRHAHHRLDSKLSGVVGVYKRLLADSHFMGAVGSVAFMQLAFTAYIAGASFVFIKVNHTPPWLFSLIFASNAFGFIGSAQFAPNLMKRFPAERLIITASCIQTVTAAVLVTLAATHHASVPALIVPLFLFLGCYGLVGGPATVIALRDQGPVAGTAASLLSFMQWGASAVGSGLVALLANGTAVPMTAVMMTGAGIAFLVVQRAFSKRLAAAAA